MDGTLGVTYGGVVDLFPAAGAADDELVIAVVRNVLVVLLVLVLGGGGSLALTLVLRDIGIGGSGLGRGGVRLQP